MEVEQAAPVGVEDQQITVADVAAQPAMVPETSPRPPDARLRELRLALVCYGGVSLAIYMHGVTKEFERLVAASVAYERDQTRHDFAAHDTAAVYWTLLQQLEQQPELWDEARRGGEQAGQAAQVRTKVVVDIVSGTSAGGINGMFLAAAIARNRSQHPLQAMWMNKGDIKRLLRGPESWPAWLKTPYVLGSVAVLRRLTAEPADLTSTDGFLTSEHSLPRAMRARLLDTLDLFGIAHGVLALQQGADVAALPAVLRRLSQVERVMAQVAVTGAEVRYRRVRSAIVQLRTLAARGTSALAEFLLRR